MAPAETRFVELKDLDAAVEAAEARVKELKRRIDKAPAIDRAFELLIVEYAAAFRERALLRPRWLAKQLAGVSR